MRSRWLAVVLGCMASAALAKEVRGPVASTQGAAAVAGNPASGARVEPQHEAPARSPDAASSTAPKEHTKASSDPLDAEHLRELAHALRDPCSHEHARPGACALSDGSPLVLEAAPLRELPGTFGDPLRGVLLLPGVTQVVSGVVQPVVRGAQPSATGVYLDGVRLPVLAHFLLGPTPFHPALVERLGVHRTSAPARLGRDTGGAVELVLDERPRTQASLDLLNVGALAQTSLSTGTEVLLAGRLGWSPWLATTVLNATRGAPADGGPRSAYLASLYDYQARVAQHFGDAELRVLAFGMGDAAGLENGSPGGRAELGAHRVDVRARTRLATAELEAGVTLGLDRAGAGGGGPLARVAMDVTERSAAARLQLAVPVQSRLRLLAGADVDVRQVDVTQTNVLVPEPDSAPLETRTGFPAARARYTGAWAEGVWREGDWTLVPGLRVDGYTLAGHGTEVVLEPRLSVRRELGESFALRAAAGLHHQAPAYLVDLPGAESASLALGLQRVVQTGVGLDWSVGPWGASVDAFVNPLLRTVELSLFDTDFLALSPEALAAARVGKGLAWGGEVRVQRALADGWTGQLGYTFQRSRRTAPVDRVDDTALVVGRETATFDSALEQQHALSAAFNVQLGGGWTAGAGLHLHSGAPEAGGLASLAQRPGVSVRDGSARWVPEDRDRVGRLPGFARLDARVAYAWQTGALHWQAVLELVNASLSREVLRYDYRKGTDGTLARVPSGLPPALPLPSLRLEATL